MPLFDGEASCASSSSEIACPVGLHRGQDCGCLPFVHTASEFYQHWHVKIVKDCCCVPWFHRFVQLHEVVPGSLLSFLPVSGFLLELALEGLKFFEPLLQFDFLGAYDDLTVVKRPSACIELLAPFSELL